MSLFFIKCQYDLHLRSLSFLVYILVLILFDLISLNMPRNCENLAKGSQGNQVTACQQKINNCFLPELINLITSTIIDETSNCLIDIFSEHTLSFLSLSSFCNAIKTCWQLLLLITTESAQRRMTAGMLWGGETIKRYGSGPFFCLSMFQL